MLTAIEWLALVEFEDDVSQEPPQRIADRANLDAAYCDAKSAWLADHPAATGQQIEEAFRAIADRLGV